MLALRVRHLVKRHPSAPGSAPVVIRLDSLDLAPGEQLALRGASGCGKTTLLHLIAGILRPDSGEIHLAGEALPLTDEAARDRLRARHLGYVFQTFNLLQGYTVRENLQLAQRFACRTTPADDAHREHLLAELGLAAHAAQLPGRLSHGQQQRVALARALVNRPALVLADEPTASLDDAHAAAVLTLLRQACVTHRAALLLATHDERALRAFPVVRDLSRDTGIPACVKTPPSRDTDIPVCAQTPPEKPPGTQAGMPVPRSRSSSPSDHASQP